MLSIGPLAIFFLALEIVEGRTAEEQAEVGIPEVQFAGNLGNVADQLAVVIVKVAIITVDRVGSAAIGQADEVFVAVLNRQLIP